MWLWEGGSFPLIHHSDFGSLLEWEMSKSDDSHKYIFCHMLKERINSENHEQLYILAFNEKTLCIVITDSQLRY